MNRLCYGFLFSEANLTFSSEDESDSSDTVYDDDDDPPTPKLQMIRSGHQLNFCRFLLVEKSLICLEGNALLFHSFRQLPRLCALLPEKRNKDTVKYGELGAEVPGRYLKQRKRKPWL